MFHSMNRTFALATFGTKCGRGGRIGEVGKKLGCPISQCSEMTPGSRWKNSEMTRVLHIVDNGGEGVLSLYSSANAQSPVTYSVFGLNVILWCYNTQLEVRRFLN